MHVIGTAGHVDHGKSSLVRALTGTDPDRWAEEKLRGMTLDLGFAHLRLDGGLEAGIVDVPGHERFLHNMLAGAAGMEVLLLIVAATEGPRRQTHEHLAILGYAGVRRAIVVLTKCDLVDDERLAEARAEVAEAIRGTVAAEASIVEVSTVTGAGLDALREAIAAALRALPERDRDAPAYLPIDRAFALTGHGTVVTGTLMQGSIGVGDVLALAPSGRSARVRALQVFGESRERVYGGMRVAANLAAVERADVRRGDVLVAPEITAQSSFDVRFRPLASALPMLRRRTPVRAYVGAAELLGTLVFEEGAPQGADADVAARLYVRAPTIGLPGGAFVVRRLSPKDVLGGGTIARPAPAAVAEPADDEPTARLAAALAAAALNGATAAELGAAANVREQMAAEVLERLCDEGRAHRLTRPAAFVCAEAVDDVEARVRAELERAQSEEPWSMGATSLALARGLTIGEPALVRALALLVDEGRIAHRAGYYATTDFRPALSPEQSALFERALAGDPAQPMVPAPLTEIVAAIRSSKIAGASHAFDTLVASGAVYKVGDDVYRAEQMAAARAALAATFGADGRITPAAFRDRLGTSRKYVVPLLEWFDATGVTVRTGDARVLRKA